MNSNLRLRFVFSLTVAGLILATPPTVSGQSIYSVSKSQTFLQNSATNVVADPNTPFNFSVQSQSNVTFTLPSGGTAPVPFVANNQDYEINQSFATKAALDAAYPVGTYRMTGTGISPLSFNLATDLYPTTTPQVTNGTWNSGGILVLNPAQANTITINSFSGYASTGVAGHMTIKVQGFSDNVSLGGDSSGILSIPNSLGLTVQTTPLTSITIPAGTLTNGHLYQGGVNFDTAATFDTTTVSGGAAVAIFTKNLNFYIAAITPGSATLPPPLIASQPTSQVGVAGGSVTLNAGVNYGQTQGQFVASSFYWYFNGQPINQDGVKYLIFGNNSGSVDSLTINKLTAADVGSYTLQVIDSGGFVTSSPASVTLATAAAPTISVQPVAQTIGTGGTVVFSVVASGTPAALTYQWKKDGANVVIGNGITNGLSSTLVIQGATAVNAGSYTVTVSNTVNSITSNSAALTVVTTTDPGRITNLSVLTDVTADVPSFTVATVVGGAGTSGTKSLVVRAAGPALGALGVPGTISDPKLDFFLGSAAINSNDNWGGSSDLATAMASAGGFPYPSPTSKDAAIAATGLQPGSYSVIVSGVGGATGSVIAEIYDATTGTFSPTSPRLINVSVNKQIGAGGLLTLGFTISGSTAKTVLVRAIGPGLVQFGYPTSAVLGDPQLTLFNSSSTQIASNDDWGADGQLTIVGGRVGAFSIGSAQTKDAMLLMTLPPGGYTAQAKGNGGTSGTAIVEVYEVP